MSGDRDAAEDSLAEQSRLIAAVERFEAAWRGGARPRIEDYLGEAGASRRSRWLCELIRLELELRARDGESPRREDYLDRFPDGSAEVAIAFTDLTEPPAAQTDRPSRQRERP
jgi:eukaryotic-like serine/threonine-protein kinase